MTSLSRFLDRYPDDDTAKIFVGLGAILIVGVSIVYTSYEKSAIREETVISAPLYGKSLQAFIETLDTKPDGKLDSLRLNKAADRLIADIVKTSMKAVALQDGFVVVPTGKELEKAHLDPDRYASVKRLEYTIRTRGKYQRSVREFGPQAAEKLASVKEVVARFEVLAKAVKQSDVLVARSELDTVQDLLEGYIVKYHSKEHDLDRSSADLRKLDRELDAFTKKVSAAPLKSM